MTKLKKKNLFGFGIVLAVVALAFSIMSLSFSYANENAEDATTDSKQEVVNPEDSGNAEEVVVDKDSNADPVINWNGLSNDYEITVREKVGGEDLTWTTTEKTFTLTGITSDNYKIDGFVTSETKATVHVDFSDTSGKNRYVSFYFDTLPGYIISMAGVSEAIKEVPKDTSSNVTFSFTKIDNPKYYIEIKGQNGVNNPLEGVDFWYMSNDGTIFPTVTTAKNAAGTEASARFEVPADKLNGYYDVSYSKLEPDTVYEDHIDTLDYTDFYWDSISKEFVYEHIYDINDISPSTLLLTSDGNIKYFQIQMERGGNHFTYCTPRISYDLGSEAPVPMSAVCNIFNGGDVTCVVDNEYVQMSIPVKVFPKDGYSFDRWETGGASYRAGQSFTISDVRELTVGKIYFTNVAIPQTGDAIPFVAIAGLGVVAVAAFVVARKRFN